MDKNEIIKKYSNEEITIVWQAAKCIHSKICWHGNEGLKEVFNPMEKPWIKPEGAITDKIIAQIDKCPSGALSYYRNNESETIEIIQNENIVETKLNGPLLVYGNVLIKDHQGNEIRKNNVTAFCRCGASANKPYCDGTHLKIGFEG